MKIDSAYFGELEIDKDKMITFEDGLPGFADLRQFIMVGKKEEDKEVFVWLQSVENENTAFALMDVFRILPSYAPEISEEDIQALGSENDEYLVYNIVVVPEVVENMTVNLLAPVVINTTTKKGRQIILNNKDYSVRQKVFDLMPEKPEGQEES